MSSSAEPHADHANIQVLQAQAEAVAFIAIRRVIEISGLSKSSIIRKIAKGEFPDAVIREGVCVRWDLAEVLRWRSEQFRKRDERRAHEIRQPGALA